MPPAIRLPFLSVPKCLFSTFPKPSVRSFWQPPAGAPSFRDHPRVLNRLNQLLPPRIIARTAQAEGEQFNWKMALGVTVGAVGLMGMWRAGGKKDVWCQAQVNPPSLPPAPPAAQSMVNPYELSFGAVCGICAGIFIKKGAKALAFLLGGVFVLLQYLGSINILKMNWSGASSVYESLTSTPSSVEGGKPSGLTVPRLWGWLVDFLTRDFQQRATFLGGLALGIRIG